MSSGEKKKRTKNPGIRNGSLTRFMRAHSGIHGGRVSSNAVATMKGITEQAVTKLGEKVAKALQLAKKKTVTINTIRYIIEEHPCKGWDAGLLEYGIPKKNKGDRHVISVQSCLRTFAKGCPLGEGNHSIAKDAKEALAVLIEGFVAKLTTDASKITEVSERVTISSKDVIAASKIRG